MLSTTARRELQRSPLVERIERAVILSPAGVTTDDPLAHRQWHLDAIELAGAWEIERGSGEVTVALLDTGVETDHPDLEGRLLPGHVLYPVAGAEMSDLHGHGTMMAGIIAANRDNRRGGAGIAEGVRILPVRVAGSGGRSFDSLLARGIDLALDSGARIILIGMGSTLPSAMLEQAVVSAERRGALVIAPIGNGGSNQAFYPAAYPTVLGVGAVDRRGLPSLLSNLSQRADLLAPGESILSTTADGGHGSLAGSSAAAAVVAGIAALLKSHDSALSPAQLRALMRHGVRRVPLGGFHDFFRAGIASAKEALGLLAGGRLLVLEPDSTWPARPLPGQAFRLPVRVTGISVGAALRVRVLLDGRQVGGQALRLEAGAVQELTFTLRAPRAPGEHALRVEVERVGTVVESAGRTLRVITTPETDVAITRMTLLPARLEDEQPLRFEVELANLGNTAAADLDLSAAMEDGGALPGWRGVLGPGSRRTLTLVWRRKLRAGETGRRMLVVRVETATADRHTGDNEVLFKFFDPVLQPGQRLQYPDIRGPDVVTDVPWRVDGGNDYVPLLFFLAELYWPARFMELRAFAISNPTRLDAPIFKEPVTPDAEKKMTVKLEGRRIYLDLGDVVSGPKEGSLVDSVRDHFGSDEGTGKKMLPRFAEETWNRVVRIPIANLSPAGTHHGVRAYALTALLDRRIRWLHSNTEARKAAESWDRFLVAKWRDFGGVLYEGFTYPYWRRHHFIHPEDRMPELGLGQYWDPHFHTMAEYSTKGEQSVPPLAHAGPLWMSVETAYSVGLVRFGSKTGAPEEIGQVKNRLLTTDHNVYFSDHEVPRNSPASAEALAELGRIKLRIGLDGRSTFKDEERQGIGAAEHAGYRRVLGDAAGQEVTLRKTDTLGTHLLVYQGPVFHGAEYGDASDLRKLVQSFAVPLQPWEWWQFGGPELRYWFRLGLPAGKNDLTVDKVLRELGKRGDTVYEGFGYAAHPFWGPVAFNPGWPRKQLDRAAGRDQDGEMKRASYFVRTNPDGTYEFPFKGMQFWNEPLRWQASDLSADSFRRLHPFHLDYDPLPPDDDDKEVKVRSLFDTKTEIGEQQFRAGFLQYADYVKSGLRYLLSDEPGEEKDIRFLRKYYWMAGSDAHGAANYLTGTYPYTAHDTWIPDFLIKKGAEIRRTPLQHQIGDTAYGSVRVFTPEGTGLDELRHGRFLNTDCLPCFRRRKARTTRARMERTTRGERTTWCSGRRTSRRGSRTQPRAR